MKATILNKEFWESRYKNQHTGWDIGYVSTPIKEYIDQLKDKNVNILIPGAGNGYEVEYLFEEGFKNVTVIDIASQAIERLKRILPESCPYRLIEGDFFDHFHSYDIVIEQTFFCALSPGLRTNYVEHMFDLLKPDGYVVGLLFNVEFEKEGPPFGGSLEEYAKLFQNKFNIKYLDLCYNSIPPRTGSEVFFKIVKS
jgi:SAM-dependent methyltransferase